MVRALRRLKVLPLSVVALATLVLVPSVASAAPEEEPPQDEQPQVVVVRPEGGETGAASHEICSPVYAPDGRNIGGRYICDYGYVGFYYPSNDSWEMFVVGTDYRMWHRWGSWNGSMVSWRQMPNGAGRANQACENEYCYLDAWPLGSGNDVRICLLGTDWDDWSKDRRGASWSRFRRGC